jgi:hypothetical protein
MITGLRVGDAAILQQLCGTDSRLFLRLGALLQARLAFTRPALESLLDSAAGKALLADRALKDANPTVFAALVATHACEALGLILVDEASGSDAGWRVVALEDEIGNPLVAAAAAESAAVPTDGIIEHVATLVPALRGPVEGLLAARADDQRAAALEQLRYAMPPLTVVGGLMPLLLADGAELVRERAVGLLVGAGAHVAVVDLVRALQRRDDAALLRLGEALSNLPADQQEVAGAALLASCVRGQASAALVLLATRLAPYLAQFRDLARLLELLVPTRLSLIDLVRALQRFDAPRVDAILRRQFGQGADLDTMLVVLLARPGAVDTDVADLLDRGLDLLLSTKVEPTERMALAGALRRLADRRPALADRIAVRAATIPAAADTSIHWLIGELCRDGAVSPAAADTLAAAVRSWLRDADGPHLVAILEQQLPALLPAADARKRALVEPLVEIIARFRDERSIDLVEAAIAAMGEAAVTPLWQLAEEHPHAPVRMLAIGLVPSLSAYTADVSGANAQGVRRLLAGLARASQAEERAALVCAAARLAVREGVPAELTAATDAATEGLGSHAVEALGHLAAGPHCPDDRRSTIIARLLDRLAEDVPHQDAAPERDADTDDLVWTLDDRLVTHTEDVPRLLAALGRIGRSPHLPPALRDQLIIRLCDQWRRVAAWQVIWGPANIQDLGALLGSLAERADFPVHLRVRICESLLPRIKQLAIARSLARALVVSGDSPYLAGIAGRAANQLVRLAGDGWYADDEAGDLADLLTDLLAIPDLGPDDAVLRRRIAALLTARHAEIAARTRQRLRALRPTLADDVRERLDWA